MNTTSSAAPRVIINTQYTKDLSFESPAAPHALVTAKKQAPQIDLNMKVGVQKYGETDFEVALHIHAKALVESQTIFLLELVYAGLFTVIDLPETQEEAVLLIHCPTILFPFARRIIADVTRDGGFLPLMIDPVDFGTLYEQHKQEQPLET